MTSSSGGHEPLIRTNQDFESAYLEKVGSLIRTEPLHRGTAHAMKDDTTSSTHELMYVVEHISVDQEVSAWQVTTQPNLPWAEDHFLERISGLPLNPPPSEARWPFARQGNAEHKKDEVFSHTYPERFWPRMANPGPAKIHHSTRSVDGVPHVGIRFEYGDFADLLTVLKANNYTRQAYLPIWFPEDLKAARLGERVPCSMGYHFIWCAECTALDMVYTLRSCDIVRFYRDDVYMAGRLLQEVADHVGLPVGTLVLHVDNLHCFPGDVPFLKQMLPTASASVVDRRTNYNFGGLY